jgi:hypothetical protein
VLLKKGVSRPEDIGTPHEQQVEYAYTFLVGVIAEDFVTEPLNRVKDEERDTEYQEVEQGQRIGQDLAHVTKIKNRTLESAVSLI